MENLKINERTAVHCETKELAEEVIKILNSYSVLWDGDNYWNQYKEKTCYTMRGTFGNKEGIKSRGYDIISAKDFIKLHQEEIPKEKEEINTGKKYDDMKLKYHLIPSECIESVAKILTFGANKYGENNWQNLEDFNNRYYSALMRHIEKWRQGEYIDPESGELHLSHAMTNICFLLWKGIQETKKNK